MWLAAPFLAASSSKQHSYLSVFELQPISVPIPDSCTACFGWRTLVASGGTLHHHAVACQGCALAVFTSLGRRNLNYGLTVSSELGSEKNDGVSCELGI